MLLKVKLILHLWWRCIKSKGCVLEHKKDSAMAKTSIGPGLYGRTEVQSITPQKVVDKWGSEKQNYNYRKNSCSGVCGHYTQVVWKNSVEVGCGMAICDNKSQVWVCNYNPPGNVEDEIPYPITSPTERPPR